MTDGIACYNPPPKQHRGYQLGHSKQAVQFRAAACPFATRRDVPP